MVLFITKFRVNFGRIVVPLRIYLQTTTHPRQCVLDVPLANFYVLDKYMHKEFPLQYIQVCRCCDSEHVHHWCCNVGLPLRLPYVRTCSDRTRRFRIGKRFTWSTCLWDQRYLFSTIQYTRSHTHTESRSLEVH